jgi:glycosyltransferase involved in cell wall biosynthesis
MLNAHLSEDRSSLSLRILQLGMAWFPEQPGGLDRYYYNLLNALRGGGATVRGLVVGSAEVDRESKGLVHAFASKQESLLSRWRRAKAAVDVELDEMRPNVVASHFALYARPALGMLRRKPHVVHFHGPWAMECRQEGDRGIGNWMKRRIERRVYRAADLCIVLSDAFRRVLVTQYGVADERVRVIPGGVEVDRFRPRGSRVEARQAMGWPTDRPILLTVRRLVPRMGLDALISAIQIVKANRPDVLLMIAGRGPLAASLEQQIRELGLQEHVKLLGFIPDDELPTAMRAADFTVVPSAALEGFGLTVVESLAAGTPCLVTPIGGLPEVTRSFAPALIFQRCDADAMASLIGDVLSGNVPVPEAARCTAFAAEHYDWNVIAPRVQSVYQEALNASQ